jgi:beta-lactamase class A
MPVSRRLSYLSKAKKAKKRKRTLFLTFLVGLSFAGGYFLFKDVSFGADKKEEDKTVALTTITNEQEETLPVAKNPQGLVADIESYLAKQTGEYGYQVVEVSSGETFGARGENSYTAASTIKVAIAAYLMKQEEAGKVNPEATITYQSQDFEGGTGVLQAYQYGTPFKIKYLMQVMLNKSDNVATNMLMRYLGASNIQKFMNTNGLAEIDVYNNKVTPRAMSQLLLKLNNAQIVSAASSAQIFEQMKNSLNPNRIQGGVSKGTVYHKIGTAVGALSDIAMIDLGTKKYILTVYSKGVVGEDIPSNVIKNISKLVFNYESN